MEDKEALNDNTEFYEPYMRQCHELAIQARGLVSPNPLVGSVILREDRIVSVGWHRHYDEAHAEAMAIRAATESVEGATLVCNLEPCSHVGRNPSCADLIVKAGIKRVVVGCVDPNPLVSGRGIGKLREAGIEVVVGVLEQESQWLNRFFMTAITEQRPYVILKVAQSLDTRVNRAPGERAAISSDQSRKVIHELRASCDAVVIGADTAIADDPQLTVRDVVGRQPYRILLDSTLRCPERLRLFNDEYTSKTIVCVAEEHANGPKARALEEQGVRLQIVETTSQGRIQLKKCFEQLYRVHGICSVLVEAGSRLSGAMVQHNIADELLIISSADLLGSGEYAFTVSTPDAIDTLPRSVEAFRLRTFVTHSVNNFGSDIHMLMLPKP